MASWQNLAILSAPFEGNGPATGGFSSHRISYSCCFLVVNLNKLLNKQLNFWWFGMPWYHAAYHVNRMISSHHLPWRITIICIVTHDSKVILFYPMCLFVCVCLSQCLSGWFRFEGLVPHKQQVIPDSKVHGANMGPIWGRQDPGGPHVGPVNFAIWDVSHTHDVIDDITRSKSRSNFEIVMTLPVLIRQYGNNYCWKLWLTEHFPDILKNLILCFGLKDRQR